MNKLISYFCSCWAKKWGRQGLQLLNITFKKVIPFCGSTWISTPWGMLMKAFNG